METLAIIYMLFGTGLMLSEYLRKGGTETLKQQLNAMKSSLLPTVNKTIRHYELP